MNAGLWNVFDIGVPAVLIGVTVLMLMVHRELGPFAGLAKAGKWMLTGAFGMGIAAFAIKLAVAAAVAKMPEHVIPRPAAHPIEAAVLNTAPTPVKLPEHYVWQALPQQAPAPADNPTTPEKVALGKRLFFDPLLSADGSVSCSSCHDVERGAGVDGRRTSVGIQGKTGQRNAPTVLNAAFQSVLFWDGRAASLEEQAKGPMLNPIEMGMPSAAAVEQRVRAQPSYREEFARVFGAGEAITMGRIASAIAAYERTLITPDAPYDRFVRGDKKALNPAQLRGMALFESLGCVACHRGPNFSDASLLGGQTALRFFPASENPYEERFQLKADGGATGRTNERGVWRVPSLRNVALTGPYFHNGSVDNLADAVRVMASAQLAAITGDDPRPKRALYWSPDERVLNHVDRRVVSDKEVEDIVAFLHALSSDALVARRGKGRPGA